MEEEMNGKGISFWGQRERERERERERLNEELIVKVEDEELRWTEA